MAVCIFSTNRAFERRPEHETTWRQARVPLASGAGGSSSGGCQAVEGAEGLRDVPVLRDIDLEIGEGEFVVFVGPSGCGKSTLLRVIAGLEDITSGDLWIGDERVNDVPPSERGIAMVFQSYALYPHM